MRKLLAIAAFAILLAPAARAQTPVSAEQAQAFYITCAASNSPKMSRESIDAMCACTSAQMQKVMTVEDINIMKGQDQAARDALNHMLLDVYAPCMNFPVQDLVEGQCLVDPKTASLPAGVDRKQICHCMAAKTGEWFTTNGRQLMAEVLKANPNITDPVDPVMEDSSFQKASMDNLSSCLTGGPAQ